MNNAARVQDARVFESETWVRVKGYRKYFVSNYGRILNTESGQTLKAFKVRGYLKVNLSELGRRQEFVHILTAQAFVPNPCCYPQVNHIDEDKENTYYKNLEWVTAQMNSEHSNSKHFLLKDPNGHKVKVFNLAQFAKRNNLDQSALHKVAIGKASHHKGWTL